MTMKGAMALGDRVKDTISGFSGILVCDATWLNGCRRVTVQPEELKDGLPIESRTFDIEQLVLMKKNIRMGPGEVRTGGPHDDPVRPAAPRRQG